MIACAEPRETEEPMKTTHGLKLAEAACLPSELVFWVSFWAHLLSSWSGGGAFFVVVFFVGGGGRFLFVCLFFLLGGGGRFFLLGGEGVWQIDR